MGLQRRTFLRRVAQGIGAIAIAAGSKFLLTSCANQGNSPPSRRISSNGLLTPGRLTWGAEDGSPYVFYDFAEPNRPLGFEAEIANAIAQLMGVQSSLILMLYDQLPVALAANQIDFILNGWEVTAERKNTQLFSQPYYRYGQQVVVRANDTRFQEYTANSEISLEILTGMRVGTGIGYKAQAILEEAPNLKAYIYRGADYLTYLQSGAIDAILVDAPLVSYQILGQGVGATKNPTLRPIGKPLFLSDYVIAFNANSSKGRILKGEVDQALSILKKDGTLRQIYERWGLWNEAQAEIGIL
ncbi:MAG: ABC transporter substrate-binding protein [Thermosynechococcus sp. Uc]|uniref:ABC transporter substrate-binding protein n=1 Tax=Thermosynechococcus sp. Uc TaxID=3034853 RepID=UPI00259F23D8|nr:ABC transporter substrate-binding protein [Thermosynechococcus sp. Uc]MDM7325846.1 ABC transporter substrate-binding protein [Thermosynechococcus sp. Uc]